jgi:hypothetical protein
MLSQLCPFAYIAERCSGISELAHILTPLNSNDADVGRTTAVVRKQPLAVEAKWDVGCVDSVAVATLADLP